MRRKHWLALASLVLLIGALPTWAFAQHRGYVGGGFRFGPTVGFYRPFAPYYFWGPGFGYWGGYWGWGYPGSVEVKRINYGIIQFNVKPESSRVFVDGKDIGAVQELQGRHHEAKMPTGYHEIRVVSPDNQSYVRTVFVALGEKYKFEHDF